MFEIIIFTDPAGEHMIFPSVSEPDRQQTTMNDERAQLDFSSITNGMTNVQGPQRRLYWPQYETVLAIVTMILVHS